MRRTGKAALLWRLQLSRGRRGIRYISRNGESLVDLFESFLEGPVAVRLTQACGYLVENSD